MNTEESANVFSQKTIGIPLKGFGILPPMPGRSAVKRKRKLRDQREATEYQAFLSGLIDQAGIKVKDFEALSVEMGRRVPSSTLATTLKKSTNPGIKTVEGIALALGMNPLDVMARFLDNPPEENLDGFEASLIAIVWNYYKRLDEQNRAYFDRYILKPFIEQMRENLVSRGKD